MICVEAMITLTGASGAEGQGEESKTRTDEGRSVGQGTGLRDEKGSQLFIVNKWR